MPKYGAHAFVWIPDWNVEAGNHAIAEAGKVGFDFIEIPLLRPAEFDPKIHKKALEDAGIGAVASTVLPRDSHPPQAPEKAKQFLKLCLDKLEAVGGTYLAGCTGYAHGYLSGEPPSEAELQAVIEVLADVAEDAKRRGMSLSLEVCNRYETYMYNSLVDAQKAVKELRAMGYDNIDLHADTYHMNIEEEGFYQPFVDTAETLGYIHMSESHRGLVGTGTVNWDQVFQGLADARYQGPLALESFAAVNPDLIAATCLWRPPNQPPDVLAREGLKFLREGAAKAGLA